MDSIYAFKKGESARLRGEPMNYFDAKKIKGLMEKHKVTIAEIFLESDREWTNTKVKIIAMTIIVKATPQSLRMNGLKGSTPRPRAATIQM